MDLKIYKINNDADMQEAFAIRRLVFVEEQSVALREEYDAYEKSAVHFLAVADGTPAGTARWRRTDHGYKLERFAVLKTWRGKGVGTALVQAVLDDLRAAVTSDPMPVYLHAQLSAIPLYLKFGFETRGEQFEEAGIMHYEMVLVHSATATASG